MQATTTLLLEAIALKKCVRAVYNRQAIKLAPHILYTRHDEMYLDAVTVEREGKPPREIKIGAYKLTGLTGLEFSGDQFERYAVFNPAEEKYAGVTLFSIEN